MKEPLPWPVRVCRRGVVGFTWACIAIWLATLFVCMPRRGDIRTRLLVPDVVCASSAAELVGAVHRLDMPDRIAPVTAVHPGGAPAFVQVRNGRLRIPLVSIDTAPQSIVVRGLPYGPLTGQSCTSTARQLRQPGPVFLLDSQLTSSVSWHDRKALGQWLRQLRDAGTVAICCFEASETYEAVQQEFAEVRTYLPLLWDADADRPETSLRRLVEHLGDARTSTAVVTVNPRLANAAVMMSLASHLLVPPRCGWDIAPQVMQHPSVQELANSMPQPRP